MKAKVVNSAAEKITTTAATQPEMVKPFEGRTTSGFEYTYDKDKLDDMEMFDILTRADAGSPGDTKEALLRLLGKEGTERLYEHLRAAEGRVRVTSLYKAMLEIVTATPDGKN